MAFSGYPDGQKAMSEMLRVIKPSGRLILLDYDYPMDRNVLGFALVRFIEMCGDIIKDIPKLIKDNHASYDKIIVGGFGSIQLFIIKK
jgi:ubiquinone/menaquinone biosynthesis C-methylase UbiE